MSKPDWLIENERKKNQIGGYKPPMCITCKYLGKPWGWTQHKGKGKYAKYECEKHPGCWNNQFSFGCDDHVYDPNWEYRQDIAPIF